MESIINFFNSLGSFGTVLSAVGLLILGYIIARLIASAVRRLLANKTNLDNRLAQMISESTGIKEFNVEQLIGTVVFWLIMLFVIVGILNAVNLPGVANPITAFLQRVTTDILPNFVGALILLGVAWLIASVLRYVITKAAGTLKVDERLTKHGALEEGEQVSVTNSIATFFFWFVFLLFLPGVLNLLGVAAVAAPLQSIFERAVGFIPNILAAGLTFIIGWFVARILRQVLSNVLAAMGADSLGERVGLSGERSISKLVGTLVYTLVLLFTLVSALDSLAIEAISGPATQMLNTITNAIPALLGAALVLAISYYIGRLVSGLITDLLAGFGFDTVPERIGLKMGGARTPSQLVGYVILVAIMLFAAVSSAELLGSSFLADILTTFVGFLGQLVSALIIFAIGLYLANLARSFVLSAAGEGATFTAGVARTAVLVLAGAMALRQLGIADDIVNMAFGILLGALAVAAALAFGLGSREIAGQEVARLVSSLRREDAPE